MGHGTNTTPIQANLAKAWCFFTQNPMGPDTQGGGVSVSQDVKERTLQSKQIQTHLGTGPDTTPITQPTI